MPSHDTQFSGLSTIPLSGSWHGLLISRPGAVGPGGAILRKDRVIPAIYLFSEKCAWNCAFYADNAEGFLRDEPHPSGLTESYVAFTPLGTILAIMPWNFSFWQVNRFAAPALMAGNTAILRHASNVPRCALAVAEVFEASGFPKGLFQKLLLPSSAVTRLIEDPPIAAITLTGSDATGSQVAAAAGRALKKTVMELVVHLTPRPVLVIHAPAAKPAQ